MTLSVVADREGRQFWDCTLCSFKTYSPSSARNHYAECGGLAEGRALEGLLAEYKRAVEHELGARIERVLGAVADAGVSRLTPAHLAAYRDSARIARLVAEGAWNGPGLEEEDY